LGDLATEHLANRALEHRLVVAEHPDRAAVDGAVPGDDAVAVERARITGGLRQGPDFEEGPGIEQLVNARTGARDALLVAPRLRLLVARVAGRLELLAEFG